MGQPGLNKIRDRPGGFSPKIMTSRHIGTNSKATTIRSYIIECQTGKNRIQITLDAYIPTNVLYLQNELYIQYYNFDLRLHGVLIPD